MAPMALSRWLFFKSASPLMSFHHIIIMMGRCGFERKLRKTLHQVMSNISESAQIRKGVKSPTQTNSTNSAGGKTLLGTHKHQETLPDTLPHQLLHDTRLPSSARHLYLPRTLCTSLQAILLAFPQWWIRRSGIILDASAGSGTTCNQPARDSWWLSRAVTFHSYSQ